MTQILFRKCAEDLTSRNGAFQYPAEGWVEAPDWDPTPKCGGGLHALRPGDDTWYLRGTVWQVITAAEDVVDLEDKVKFRRGYCCSNVDMEPYRELFLQYSQWAYHYARDVDQGPRNDTRAAACKDPRWAYRYAQDIDRDSSD